MKGLAGALADSPLFGRARDLLARNIEDWNYPLNKWQKLWVGGYLILKDYSLGLFPPKYEDEQVAFDNERNYYETLKGMGKSDAELDSSCMRKPFWQGQLCHNELSDFGELQLAFQKLGVEPPARLLEVGCGTAWMSEFFAAMGFSIMATTIEEDSRIYAEKRMESLRVKGLSADIEFRTAPMEYIDKAVEDVEPFDGLFVYEALHHAYSWEKSIGAFARCLKPGGWCIIANEPNLLHTFVSYRVGKLSNTHEVGINPGSLQRKLKEAGFSKVVVLENRFHLGYKPIWIAAQR